MGSALGPEWTGLTPSLYRSGDVRFTGRITKLGNSGLRWYLMQAAQGAARHNPKMMQVYERIANKRKGNGKAIVAMARRLLVRIYWLLVCQG
ncbi:MAG: IS110 family transposase [Nitrososphaerota archaeon]|jgi:transposase|nr:IS110 family transposase [Nitrososphaerota archaeon]MDG7040695.1 IS110 family transposase [Nitrososphaerota archaeon]